MNAHKRFSKILSLILSLSMFLSLIPASVFAYEVDSEDDASISGNNVENRNISVIEDDETSRNDIVDDPYSINSEDIQVEGSDSLGDLIAEAVGEELDEYNKGYMVISTEIKDGKAIVEYFTREDAILVVGIYDEQGEKQITSGYVNVVSEDKIAEVSFNEELPQYFYVKSYLIDPVTYKPFCKAFECPNYTKEMQEFFSKTTDDFEDDRVYNLDSNKSNNFAVFEDDVLVKESQGESNIVTNTNSENNTYTILDADEDVKNLKIGDYFAYEESDGVLIIKVAGIEVSGDTVYLMGANIDLEEAFEYIKIDTAGDMDGLLFDDSDADAGVEYEGVGERTDDYSTCIVNNSDELLSSEGAWEGGGKTNGELKFKFAETGTVTGKVGIEIESSLKFYLSSSYRSLELKLDLDMGFEIENKVPLDECKRKLGKAKLPTQIPLVNISVNLYFRASLDMALKIKGGVLFTAGFQYDSDHGLKDISAAKPYLDTQIEGKVFVGLEIDPVLEVVSKYVCEVEGEICAGAELTGKRTFGEKEDHDTEWHKCVLCYAGEVSAVFSFDLKGKLLNHEKWGFKLKLANLSYKLFDWYFSNDLNKLGKGICPNRSYLLTVDVKDVYGKLLDGVRVEAMDNKKTTIYSGLTSGGEVSEFLEPGTYSIEINKPGYSTKTQKVKIEKHPRKIVVYFDEVIDTSVILDDGDHSNNNYISNNYTSYSNNSDSLNTIFSKNIRQVETSDDYNYGNLAIVTTDNKLYIQDTNYNGTLFTDNGDLNCSIPHFVMDNVYKVAVGEGAYGCYQEENTYGVYQTTMYLAIKTDGSLYRWYSRYDDDYENVPHPSSKPEKVLDDIKDVTLDDRHVVALAKNGDVYTWGCNIVGELGLKTVDGQDFLFYDTPQKVMSGAKDICAGGGRTFVITNNNDLYFTGDRNYLFKSEELFKYHGDTGHSFNNTFELYKKGVESITSDGFSFAYITPDHKLYQFGYGVEDNNEYTPMYVMDNVDECVIRGGLFTAKKTNGDVYIWTIRSEDKVFDKVPKKWLNDISYVSGWGWFVSNRGEVFSIVGDPLKYYGVAESVKDFLFTEYGAMGYIDTKGDLYMMDATPVTPSPGILGNGTLDHSKDFVFVMHNADHFADLGGAYNKVGVITKNHELYLWGSGVYYDVEKKVSVLKPTKVCENVKDLQNSKLITTSNKKYSVDTSCVSDFLRTKYSGSDDYEDIYIYDYINRASDHYRLREDGVLVKYNHSDPNIIARNVKCVKKEHGVLAYLNNNKELYVEITSNEAAACGILGNGTTKYVSGFNKVLDNVEDFIFLCDTDDPTCIALKTDGSVWFWGSNNASRVLPTYFNFKYNIYTTPVRIRNNVKKLIQQQSSFLGKGKYGFITDEGVAYIYDDYNLSKLHLKTRVDMDYYLSRLESSYSNDDEIITSESAEDDSLSSEGISGFAEQTVDKMCGTMNFHHMIPNMTYGYYLVKDLNEEIFFGEDNLLYIGVTEADDNGTLHLAYDTDKQFDEGEIIAIPMECETAETIKVNPQTQLHSNEDVVDISFDMKEILPLIEISVAREDKNNSNVVWLMTHKESEGRYVASLPMSVFDYEAGKYKVKVFGTDFFMNIAEIGETTFSISKTNYTITYILNDSDTEFATNPISNPKLYNNTSGTIVLAPPVRDGYNFDGWYLDSGLTSRISNIDSSWQKNLSLYAKWSEKSDSIGQGGNSESDTSSTNPTVNNENDLSSGDKIRGAGTINVAPVIAQTNLNSDSNGNYFDMPYGTPEKKNSSLWKGKLLYSVKSSSANSPTVVFEGVISDVKSVKIPDTVTFNGVKYKVTEISSCALCDKKKLQSVTIGKNVKKIGSLAFDGSKKLKKVVIKSQKLTSKNVKKCFGGTSKKLTITVPKSKYKSYKAFLKKKGNKNVKVKK